MAAVTRRRVLSGLLIVLAVALSVVSGFVHRDFRETNSSIILFPIELFALPVGAVAAGRSLHSRPDLARGVLGVGMYLLMVAGAIRTIYPIWLPQDDTILGSALLAGVWAGVGAYLALASAAVIAGWSSSRTSFVSATCAVLAFLLVTIGGMVWPLFQLRIPILTIVAVAVAALVVARDPTPTGRATGSPCAPRRCSNAGSAADARPG